MTTSRQAPVANMFNIALSGERAYPLFLNKYPLSLRAFGSGRGWVKTYEKNHEGCNLCISVLSALRLNLSEYHVHGGGAVCGVIGQDEPSGLDLLVGDVAANVISYVYHSGEIFFDVEIALGL